MSQNFTLYSTSWCPFSNRLKYDLDKARIEYTEIDIERTPEAATIVEGINRGNRTVPTLVFDDGSALTNPSLEQVRTKIG
ncbi:glutaredoxin domain-containing protein [Nakamurella sp. A5-74]|uniref:Glutaredoxin domain-containing protein n=1 Tax=Nakamurella sp. A5-74 TaxID=3158264 RepID=A0AAU8DUX6_9ACTN